MANPYARQPDEDPDALETPATFRAFLGAAPMDEGVRGLTSVPSDSALDAEIVMMFGDAFVTPLQSDEPDFYLPSGPQVRGAC